MASLFNTKISDTYPGLIKTLDNAAISASLKELTDGSGNQSGLFINTAGDFKASGILEFGSLKDTGENITITKFVDEADGIANNDNDTTIPTSAAVVDYVASRITLEDLDFSGDSGTGSVDLDSQVFAITGTINQIQTTASGQGISFAFPSTGIVLPNGSTATTQTDGDNSTKIATTAYVDTAIQGHDTLAEVLVGGNITGGTDIAVSAFDDITFTDSSKILMGASSDLEIYHDGSNSYIKETGTGNLIIRGANRVHIQDDAGESMARFLKDAGNEFYYNNIKKLETTSVGATVSGDLTVIGSITGSGGSYLPLAGGTMTGDVIYTDGVKAKFGTGSDLEIHHSSNNSFINELGAGDLYIQTAGTNIFLRNSVSGNQFISMNTGNDNVILKYGGATKIETTTGGVLVTGGVSATTESFFYGGLLVTDSQKIKVGTSADLQIYHDGSNSYIDETGTGSLYIKSAGAIRLQSDIGENMIYAQNDGAVNLYFNNVNRLQTTSTGVSVTGNMVASGDVYAEDNIYLTDTGTARATISLDSSDRDNLNIKAISLGSLMRFYTQDTLALALDASQNASFSQSVTIAGDLTVNGTTTTVNTEHFNVEDPLISMAKDNAANSVDIGFYGRYNNGTNRYTGLFMDASSGTEMYRLFKGTTSEPTTTVDIGATGYSAASLSVDGLVANLVTSSGDVVADTHFNSSDANATLSTTGAGTIFLRPNGKGSTSGQLTVSASGNVNVAGDINLLDNKKINLGSGGSDLTLYHTGSTSYIRNNTGNLEIRNQTSSASDLLLMGQSANGLQTYITLDGSIESIMVNKDILMFNDGNNGKLKFGASQDLQIYHDASHSYIQDTGTGNLLITSDGASVQINKGLTENMAEFITDGAVNLYYDSAKKFETTSFGAAIVNLSNTSAATETQDKIKFGSFGAGRSAIFLDTSNTSYTNRTWFIENLGSGGMLRFGRNGKDIMHIHNDGDVQMSDNLSIGTPTADQTGYGYNTITVMGGSTVGYSGVLELLAPSVDAEGQNYGIISMGAGGTRTAMISANRQTTNGAANLRFWTSPSGGIVERMRIDKSGTIKGIGTYTAGNSIKIFEAERSGGAVKSDWSYHDSNTTMSFGTSTNHPLSIKTNDTERIRVQNNGSIGIGTNDPQKKVHIYDSTHANQAVRFGNPAGTPYGEIQYDPSGFEHLYIRSKGTTTGYGNIVFETGSSPSEAMVINSSGDVQFNGNTLISTNTADGSDNAQLIIAGGGADGDTRGASIHLAGNESGNGGLLQLRAGDGSVGGIRFYEGGSERMRLYGNRLTFGNAGYGSSLGQVVINNDASSSPASLSLFGYNNVADDDGFANIDFAMQSSGTGGNITASIRGRANGTDENASDLAFYTKASSGTLTEKMRINDSGLVEISSNNENQASHEQTLAIKRGLSAAGTVVPIAFVDHTHALDITVIVKQNTSNVASGKGRSLVAYGSANTGMEVVQGAGNVTDITLAYLNTNPSGQDYVLTLTWSGSGASPDAYITIRGNSTSKITEY